MTGPVFLSASEPARDRDPRYWDTQILVNIRAAVRALCARILPFRPLVYGGHPAISPLVNGIAQDVALLPVPGTTASAHPRIACYQSRHFDLPDRPDIVQAPAIQGRDKAESRHLSLLLMRYLMLDVPQEALDDPGPVLEGGNAEAWRAGLAGLDLAALREARTARVGAAPLAAGIFIGGMEGVEAEYNIFRTFHPDTPAYVLPTTGAAARLLAQPLADQQPDLHRVLAAEDGSFPALFQSLFPVTPDRRLSLWRPTPPTDRERRRHADWSISAGGRGP